MARGRGQTGAPSEPRVAAQGPRARGILALVAVAGAALTAAPATAGTSRYATVTSVLKLTGTGSAFEHVRITKPMRRPAEATITASGDRGRIAVMLVAVGGFDREPPNLVADRLPVPLGGTWQVTMGGNSTADGPTEILPAGDYRAYVVAPSRTTVTLRLPGQPGGATSVTTRVKVRSRNSELAPQKVGDEYRPVAETNESYTFSRPGLALTVGVLDYAVLSQYSIGGCFYEGSPPAAESIAQVCAGGTSFGKDGGYVVPNTTPGRITGGLLTLPVQPRTVSFGLYYQVVGRLTAVRQFNLWVEFLP